MSFGEKILQKYGYQKGQGLGRNENGIKEAIKANFKFDQSGLGSHESERRSDHWWQRVFAEAASNIKIETSEDHNNDDKSSENIRIHLLDSENGVELTNKSYSMKKLKKHNASLKYGCFLKSSTLLANEEKRNDDSITSVDIEIEPVKVLDDDELFRICGGRTAHKSARHGLKLEGKLKRVAEQEQEFLEKMKKSKLNTHGRSIADDVEKSRKNAAAILNSSTESVQKDECPLPVEDDNKDYSNSCVSKRKRKREKQNTSELASKILDMDLKDAHDSVSKIISEVDETSQRKKKKTKKNNRDFLGYNVVSYQNEPEPKRKRKNHLKGTATEDNQNFKKSKKNNFDSDDDSLDDKLEEINQVTCIEGIVNDKKKRQKKSSKKKHKKNAKEIAAILDNQLNF